MKDKIIAAALTEMEIHSLRFTMEDLTRRLHIGRNSLYKVVSSKDALIKSIIDYKTTHFSECAEKILAGADDTDTKIKKILQLYADTFGTMGNHIGRDLQSMYPDVWQGWQDFHRRTIHTVIELIKIGTDEGLYRNVNLSVVEEILTVLFEALGSAEFLNRTHFSYKETTDTVGDLVLYGLKAR